MSSSQTVVLAVFGVLAGFAVGSFTCVVIERLPFALDEPDEFGDLYGMRPWREVIGGSSRCSSCGAPIRWYDKIPFVSWIVLRGRCRTCAAAIPRFHPIVEIMVPAIGLGLGVALEWGWRSLPVLWLVPVGVAVSAIDLRTYMVPTRVVWPALGVAVVLSGVASLLAHEPSWLLGGVVGVAVVAGPLFLTWFALPRGMGFGDVRLAVLLGWTVGFASISGRVATVVFIGVATLALAAILGIVIGVAALSARGRHAKVPFGPALVIAAFVMAAWSQEILRGFRII